MASAAKKKKPTPTKKTKAVVKAAPKKTPVKTVTPTKPSSAASTLKPLPRPSLVTQLASSAANAPRLPARLQAAIDKTEIADVVHSFARGLDRMDENLLRSIFHPDMTVDLGPGIFQGTGSDYIHWVLGMLQQARMTHHLVGSVHAQVEGDVALVESYGHIHYRLDKPTGREDLFRGIRFLDRFERRPAGPAGVWKIIHRKEVIDWVRTEAASDVFYHHNPDALWSARTKADPSTQMAQFPGSQSGGKLPAFLGRRYESRSVRL